MRGPLVRGRHDCLTCSCAASRALYGRDPLACGVPEYRSLTAALRILRAHGGWLEWAADAFEAAGMVRADSEAPGDLCVIDKGEAGHGFALAIRSGEFAVKAKTGCAVIPSKAIGVWRWE